MSINRAYRLLLGVIGVACLTAGCNPSPPPPDDAGGDPSAYRLVPPPSAADSVAAARVVDALSRLPAEVFEAHTFRGAGGVTLPYRLLPPVSPEPGARYPLVVVFHGAGEIGTDNLKHLDRFPKLWARPELRSRYPAYVLAPQMPARSSVYSSEAGAPNRRSEPAPPLHAALALIDSLKAALPVDSARVYAIGFSMGASTTWNALYLRPDLFAAAIPIAGVPNPAHAPQVAQTPVWILHGNRDTANLLDQDRAMYDTLRARGAPVRFWEFDGGVHEVPPALLAGAAFPQWLFSHRKTTRDVLR